MAIKIHYGPNGSYKSSGAVWDDVVPAIKEGRVVISNVRGMSEERCRKAFPEAPESFKLIHIDMDSMEGLERCRTWFRWAPKGALIIFDETQLIFLAEWRVKDLSLFNHPGGPEGAKADDQPKDWLDAWTRHRHWNWDVVLTTPNIKYIRADIRRTSEGAFKHSNFALLGGVAKKLLGDYKEVFHDAQLNNPPPKAITKLRRINKKVFELYDSTATGQIKDTSAGSSIFASIPLMVLLAVFGVAMFVGFSGKGVTGWFVATPKKPVVETPVATVPVVGVAGAPQNINISGSSAADHPIDRVGLMLQLFDKYTVYLLSTVSVNPFDTDYLLEFVDKNGQRAFKLRSRDLYENYGMMVESTSPCLLYLQLPASHFLKLVTCRPDPIERDNKNSSQLAAVAQSG